MSNPSNRKIEGGYRQIRSSAWLEHYTDNVGVSSSNLLGSTINDGPSGSPPVAAFGRGEREEDDDELEVFLGD